MAPRPQRQLLRGRRGKTAESHAGARKGLGIQAGHKVLAGRNYHEPDDDLLI